MVLLMEVATSWLLVSHVGHIPNFHRNETPRQPVFELTPYHIVAMFNSAIVFDMFVFNIIPPQSTHPALD